MISIIVPVYNCEEYLHRCIKSIIHQIYTDWELILVDDGSTDKSAQICKEYSKRDNRIIFFQQKNSGVSSARNAGLLLAHGEYFCFIDADDFVTNELLIVLINDINKADLVISGYSEILDGKCVRTHSYYNNLITLEQFKNNLDRFIDCGILNPPFAKLFRKDLAMGLKFDTNIMLGEDLVFNIQYLNRCSNIKINNSTTYMYNISNENSATKKIRKNDFDQVVSLYLLAKKFKYTEENMDGNYPIDLLDRKLCLDGLGLIQLAFYSSDIVLIGKVKQFLNNSYFRRCCMYNYRLSIKYAIPQKLCKRKMFLGLKVFFFIKKAISKR